MLHRINVAFINSKNSAIKIDIQHIEAFNIEAINIIMGR